MISIIKKIFFILALGGKRKLFFLFIAIVGMAVVDILGMASIFPFLNVMSNPEIVQQNAQLKWFYEHFGFHSTDKFLVAIGLVSFFVLLFNNIFRAGVNLALLRFTWAKRYLISRELLAYYLHEPYMFFLNRNTSELTTYLASEIARAVNGVLIPSLQVLSRSLLTVFIIAFLFVIHPTIAAFVIGLIGGGYVLIYMVSRKKLSRAGQEMVEHSQRIFKALHEAFGGIKDIKLLGKEDVFIEDYSDPVKKYIDCSCAQFLIAHCPRYAFEVLTFGGILGYIAFMQRDYQQVMPLVGIFAFAAYRLMPALQQIYRDLTLIRFTLPALECVYKDYRYCVTHRYAPVKTTETAMTFKDEIQLKGIRFRYPKAQKDVLDRLNMRIKSNTTIGFVGGSGAGKTTIVDILLGLLQPQEGGIYVDGIKIDENNLRRWQKNIGYVPQHIYLCDDTVIKNIAFGIREEEIDLDAVKKAAELANIHHFIEHELPRGYDTEVGERGVRLSGGQRQRIGIARALYHNPSVLVFDEATSALDGITEELVLEAIQKLAHKKTIILIAHRLTTLESCDRIYFIEQGRIVDQGRYHELLERNAKFRQMAKAAPEPSSCASGKE